MTVMALTIMVGARAGQVGEKQARQKASAFMTGQATTRGEVSMTRVYQYEELAAGLCYED